MRTFQAAEHACTAMRHACTHVSQLLHGCAREHQFTIAARQLAVFLFSDSHETRWYFGTKSFRSQVAKPQHLRPKPQTLDPTVSPKRPCPLAEILALRSEGTCSNRSAMYSTPLRFVRDTRPCLFTCRQSVEMCPYPSIPQSQRQDTTGLAI